MIKVGSRDSRLAIAQAEEVCRALGDCQLITMKTTGDRILDKSLDKVGGKGLFVKELDLALADGRIDLAVHSLKDVPMEQPTGFPIISYTKREDARDVLVLPPSGEWDKSKPIGCSAARRRLQLRELYPEIEVQPVRGNVQTRLAKLDSGAYGALVLAAAGLHRLGLSARISRYFSIEEILPAAGQAILAVQGKEEARAQLAQAVNDADAQDCALAERSYIKTLGGGCFSPAAAYAEVDGDFLHLHGLYVTADERTLVRGAVTGRRREAVSLGRTLALQLRQQAEGFIWQER